jgi:hypothetical protein
MVEATRDRGEMMEAQSEELLMTVALLPEVMPGGLPLPETTTAGMPGEQPIMTTTILLELVIRLWARKMLLVSTPGALLIMLRPMSGALKLTRIPLRLLLAAGPLQMITITKAVEAGEMMMLCAP